jgi:hypothetical protein
MRYVTDPTCQSDVDMKEIFNSYLSVVLNFLNHDPIILVGRNENIRR